MTDPYLIDPENPGPEEVTMLTCTRCFQPDWNSIGAVESFAESQMDADAVIAVCVNWTCNDCARELAEEAAFEREMQRYKEKI